VYWCVAMVLLVVGVVDMCAESKVVGGTEGSAKPKFISRLLKVNMLFKFHIPSSISMEHGGST